MWAVAGGTEDRTWVVLVQQPGVDLVSLAALMSRCKTADSLLRCTNINP